MTVVGLPTTVVGLPMTVVGLKTTVVGLQMTVVGLPTTVVGLRMTVIGIRIAAVVTLNRRNRKQMKNNSKPTFRNSYAFTLAGIYSFKVSSLIILVAPPYLSIRNNTYLISAQIVR